MQRQNDTAIRSLTRALGKFSLTKSEKLQIVNLAPRQLVELYVVCTQHFGSRAYLLTKSRRLSKIWKRGSMTTT